MENVLIVWTPDNNLGIPIIDEQHRGIVSTINSLFYFMRNKRGLEAMNPTISMIEQYTKIHFLTEEALLERSAYPGRENHLNLHQRLNEKMFSVSTVSKRTGNPEELLTFLKSWWMNHINEHDRAYADHVRQYLHDLDMVK